MKRLVREEAVLKILKKIKKISKKVLTKNGNRIILQTVNSNY